MMKYHDTEFHQLEDRSINNSLEVIEDAWELQKNNMQVPELLRYRHLLKQCPI